MCKYSVIDQMNRKIKHFVVIVASLFIFSACYTSSRISQFSSDHVALGITKDAFIKKYGEPFYKEVSYLSEHQKQEKLFYKEELHKGSWFIVTTAFTFVEGELIKQEIVKEERAHRNCDCDK